MEELESSDPDTGTYLYAVTRCPGRGHPASRVSTRVGSDSSNIEDFVALVSDVDLSDYGEEGLPHKPRGPAVAEERLRGGTTRSCAPLAGPADRSHRSGSPRSSSTTRACSPASTSATRLWCGRSNGSTTGWSGASRRSSLGAASADEAPDGFDTQSDVEPGSRGSGTDYLMQKRGRRQQRREAVADQGAALAEDPPSGALGRRGGEPTALPGRTRDSPATRARWC